jgi:Na+-transporting methylmalonyl-CoA/oxaloacetate decarboxylase gamma subunit
MKNSTFVILVVVVLILVFWGISRLGSSEVPREPPKTTLTKISGTPTPTSVSNITPTITPRVTTIIEPEITLNYPEFPISPGDNIEFVLDPGIPTSCGLTCRETTATITNEGNKTAHNVCVWFSISNENGDNIPLNGVPSVYTCIGNLTTGIPVSEPMTLEADCGLLALNCIGQDLILSAKITSDEKTVTFPDQHFGGINETE